MLLGRPHEQESGYHILPSEIKAVLRTLRDLVAQGDDFELAVTAEILPLIFQCKNGTVLIDIRANYPYQTIQGLRITGEPATVAKFASEFERLWHASGTISDQAAVHHLLSLSLVDWEQTGRLRSGRWPAMWNSVRRGPN